MQNFNYIKLKGHERPLTDIICNDKNNLIISSSKDPDIVLWNKSETDDSYLSRKINSTGATWVIGISDNNIFSGSADGTMKLWDQNKQVKFSFDSGGPIKCVKYHQDKEIYLLLSKKLKENKSILIILNKSLQVINSKIIEESNKAVFYKDKIICCGIDGIIRFFSFKENNFLQEDIIQNHNSEITNIEIDVSKNILVTSSLDNYLNIINLQTFDVIAKYKHCVSILSFSIHPSKKVIVLGGGQDKMQVAKSKESGEFNLIFISSETGKKLFQYDSKHFGPINTICFNSIKEGVITGGEDGYIHLWNFDNNWLENGISNFEKEELNKIKLLLEESKIIYQSLLGTGKKSKNQRRNLSKKISKLETFLLEKNI